MTEINNIKAALRLCHCPDWAFRQVEKKIREKTNQRKRKNLKSESSNPSGNLVVLPCVKGLLEVTAQVLKTYDRTVSFRPANSIGQQLFQLKDKADQIKIYDTVYNVD